MGNFRGVTLGFLIYGCCEVILEDGFSKLCINHRNDLGKEIYRWVQSI